MSYQFKPNHYYRMPTHFGPALGPRQGVDGRRYPNIDTPNDLLVRATFPADKAQLEKFLPPGFVLREPYQVSFDFQYIGNPEWLAGRSYNTLGVGIPASYQGKEDTVDGDLLLVLWEGIADAVTTGREEIGFPKVYGDIPDAQCIGDDIICRASWDGCEFFTLKLSQLTVASEEAIPDSFLSPGILSYKYVPKTGAPGVPDAEYAVFTPADTPNFQLEEVKLGQATTIGFRQSTWEELPTLVHIVNALAELRLGECSEAVVLKSHGTKDLSDSRILR